MEETHFKSLSAERQKDVAVAYLLKNKNEIPDGLEKLFKKLENLESSAFSIMLAVKEAKRTISMLAPKSEQLAGAMGALSDLISDELTEDQIVKFGLKYQEPSTDNNSEPDIAGSTAMAYNNSNPVPSRSNNGILE